MFTSNHAARSNIAMLPCPILLLHKSKSDTIKVNRRAILESMSFLDALLCVTKLLESLQSHAVLFVAVTKLIETAQPSIDYTQRKYGDAHDAVVASATYNRALEAAAEVLQRLQVCMLYQGFDDIVGLEFK